jgi:subfamily B ATP-binding cassette protein MsbA
MEHEDHQSDWQLYRRLLSYVTPYWLVFIISLAALMTQALTEPLKAAILEPMIDQLFIEKNEEMIVIIPLLIFFIFLVSGIASFIGNSCMHWVSNNVVKDLRKDMFASLINLPSEYYDRNSVGSILSKYTFDVIQVKEASSNAISVIVKDSIMITGLLGWMLYLDWLLTCIALVGTPFIFTVIYFVRKRLRSMSIKVQDTMVNLNHILSEVINGIRVVKLFGGQAQEMKRFSEIINANRLFNMKLVYASAASSPIVQQVAALALAVIVYVAAGRALDNQLTIGQFGSFIAAMIMLMDPLKRLVRVNEDIQKGMAASVTVFGLLDESEEVDEGSIDLPPLTGSIEIKNLAHQYATSSENALEDISININAGETVALVGSSGSGKTTLANLLPRFYRNSNGKVFLDGHDIDDVSLSSLRDNIGLVSQDVVLFNDSIRNNIAFGKYRDSSEEAIISAATSAHAMEFIERLPEGLDTNVGEKGSLLSGGQRQRVALARALLKDAPILILDEATSSLDTESERHIQLALEEIRKGRTCIIIAHRLSTIVSADKVFVLENGKIVESGNHQDLLEKNGVYARFYQSRSPDK